MRDAVARRRGRSTASSSAAARTSIQHIRHAPAASGCSRASTRACCAASCSAPAERELIAAADILTTAAFGQGLDLFEAVIACPSRGLRAVDFTNANDIGDPLAFVERHAAHFDVGLFGLTPGDGALIDGLEQLARRRERLLVVTLGARRQRRARRRRADRVCRAARRSTSSTPRGPATRSPRASSAPTRATATSPARSRAGASRRARRSAGSARSEHAALARRPPAADASLVGAHDQTGRRSPAGATNVVARAIPNPILALPVLLLALGAAGAGPRPHHRGHLVRPRRGARHLAARAAAARPSDGASPRAARGRTSSGSPTSSRTGSSWRAGSGSCRWSTPACS